ncbi:hypothetical protein DAI22_02g246300 [Oryza sativa Japonica Group]|nr:hypothetical protein DAI22_02g246300 [Oryza sativa Japonica Group]
MPEISAVRGTRIPRRQRMRGWNGRNPPHRRRRGGEERRGDGRELWLRYLLFSAAGRVGRWNGWAPSLPPPPPVSSSPSSRAITRTRRGKKVGSRRIARGRKRECVRTEPPRCCGGGLVRWWAAAAPMRLGSTWASAVGWDPNRIGPTVKLGD